MSDCDCCLDGVLGFVMLPLPLALSESEALPAWLPSPSLDTLACENMRVRRFVIDGFLVGVGTLRLSCAETCSSGMTGVGFAGLPSCDFSDAAESDAVGEGRCARVVVCPFMSCVVLGVEIVGGWMDCIMADVSPGRARALTPRVASLKIGVNTQMSLLVEERAGEAF